MNHLRNGLAFKAFRNLARRPFNTSSKSAIRRHPKDSNGKDFSRPLVEEAETNYAPVGWTSLIKPAAFTVTFSASCFGLASVWQYENMRTNVLQQKTAKNSVQSLWSSLIQDRKETNNSNADSNYNNHPAVQKFASWRNEINIWWNTKLTDGQRMFIPICALNVMIYGLWRLPVLRPVMKKYFCANPAAPNNCWPMLLSAFSHYSFFHLAANMFVLHSFSTNIVAIMGREQFMALYLTSAVFSSFCSHAFKILSGRMAMSLGASGAICTVLGVFGTLVPQATMQVVFLPFIQFSAASAIKGLIAIDTIGLIARWTYFDHAAHLGGILLGVWYCHFGYKLIWENREPIMTWWHQNIRNRTNPPT